MAHPRATPADNIPLNYKFEFGGVVEFTSEDGGSALIGEPLPLLHNLNPESGLAVRLVSWDEAFSNGDTDIPEAHAKAEFLRGKKIKVTIEVVS